MITLLLIAAAGALVGILSSVYILSRRAAGASSEIAPASDLQRKYGLYAENRPVIRLSPEQVPSHLRHLIPLAEKWGIGDDIIRHDYIAKASKTEKRELHDAFYEPYERITAWLGGFRANPMAEEAEAFMYAQMALDEMGYYILEEKQRERETPRDLCSKCLPWWHPRVTPPAQICWHRPAPTSGSPWPAPGPGRRSRRRSAVGGWRCIARPRATAWNR